MNVTAAICTYNGAALLPRVLDHLEAQKGLGGVDWEVIVVDNNSTDETAEIVKQRIDSWSADAPLRYLFEDRQGKSFAIQSAVEVAKGDLVALLDDDTYPAADWILRVHEFGSEHPEAGVFGGQIHPLVDVDLPNTFGLVKPLLFPNENPDTFEYSAHGKLRLGASGSGLVIRRMGWDSALSGRELEFKGPTGAGRGTLGEEYEIQWKYYRDGWEIWHNGNMHLNHHIPASRFETNYLKGFFKAIGLSRYHTRMMRFPTWQKPLMTVAYWGVDLAKLARLAARYRSRILSDRFVNGRARLILYSIVSPFVQRD
ncbi:MAG: glycosyltransferase family 2 protein [Rhodothermales bacterium]|nr:glycosyltransferase family 2 protein [Rhodothermales bacterium]